LIANGASEVDALPSLTAIMIFAELPWSAVAGVPESWPVAALNCAHSGLFWMLKLRVSLSASAALGTKL
jgi:hypothetical protein